MFYKKYFGQCFLIDKSVIKKIVGYIKPIQNNKYIYFEVGPGHAALTKPMCKILKKILVIDIDKDILNFLRKKKFFYKIKFYHQDVLKFNFLNILKKKKIRIFGNLPYNISTRLLLKLLKYSFIFKDLYFMVQKEVALRLFSSYGNKFYGRLSIIIQRFFKVFLLFDVYPDSFFPKPKVNSTFIKLIPRNFLFYNENYINILKKITSLAFQQRRKMIKKNFSSLFSESFLLNFGINPNLRAEQIPKEKYYDLVDFIIKKNFLINEIL